MDIISVLHGNTQFITMQNDSCVTLNIAGKQIDDDISASINLSYYDRSHVGVVGDKPSNLTPSGIYRGIEITNGYVCPAHVTLTGSDRGITAGTYTATYTPESGYCWSDESTSSVTITLTIINKTSVGSKPYTQPTALFTGSDITNGYTCPANVSKTGNDTGRAAGTYIATYTPNEGYMWNDGTTESINVVLSILAPRPLCFSANTAESTISMSVTGTPTLGQNFQTSSDGITWSTFTPGSTTITLQNVGDKVYFRGNNTSGVSESSSIYYKFSMTGSIAASGNIMSLIDNGTCTTTVVPNSYCFYSLFYGCDSLTTAPELPATTLASSCYRLMFCYCVSLTSAYDLPAAILSSFCYSSMFYGCSSLLAAPIIYGTSAYENSCYAMFYNCVSMLTTPDLQITSMYDDCCCYGMFSKCKSLTSAPRLPATTLVPNCYDSMFQYCSSLVIPPVLPSTTLQKQCYQNMFCGCTSLIVSDTSGTGYDKSWRIPTSESFTNTYSQYRMFYDCVGTRSSDNMDGAAGQSYTYYTQNTPV